MQYPLSHVAGQRVSVLAACLFSVFQANAQAPSSAAPEPTTLDEIVVRGEKTDRSLQDTTASVAVSTSVRIEQENLLNLFDVLNRTANVSQMYGDRGFTLVLPVERVRPLAMSAEDALRFCLTAGVGRPGRVS